MVPERLDADSLLDAFAAELPVSWDEVDPPAATRRAWSAFVMPRLVLAAERFGMVGCAKTFGSKVPWARREHLYDLTWFARDCGPFASPSLLLEHENDYAESAFLEDFWKLLFGWAPLRVMVGYTRSAEARTARVERVNEVLRDPANAIGFPEGVTDLLLLGHWGMAPRGFAAWRREGGVFVPFRSELALPSPSHEAAWERWRGAFDARADANVREATRAVEEILGEDVREASLPADMLPESPTSVTTG